MSPLADVLIAVSISLEVVGQTCLKVGLNRIPQAPSPVGGLSFWYRAFSNFWVVLGIGAYAAEVCVWLAVLTVAPLSEAFPIISLSYCGVAVSSHFFLGEKLGRRKLLAMAMIVVGVTIVSIGHWGDSP